MISSHHLKLVNNVYLLYVVSNIRQRHLCIQEMKLFADKVDVDKRLA